MNERSKNQTTDSISILLSFYILTPTLIFLRNNQQKTNEIDTNNTVNKIIENNISMGETTVVTASEVLSICQTIQGCLPTSATAQPSWLAINGNNTDHIANFIKNTDNFELQLNKSPLHHK